MAIKQAPSYQFVTLTKDQNVKVKNVVEKWIDVQIDEMSDDEKRAILPKLTGHIYVNDCVSFVMANLPDGVKRVDGPSIRPLLNEVIQEKQKQLPPPAEFEEMENI